MNACDKTDEFSLNNKTKWSIVWFEVLNIFFVGMKKPACAGLMFGDGCMGLDQALLNSNADADDLTHAV
ncbi:hypothetical protein ET1_08_00830 [Edwardsiella tarda ATCC 15947 = NBRC 105688]|nr:hypothetical protein ET1_08_00830 [Edwardsiella tarda ATCC 15947 = NBRC 105688]